MKILYLITSLEAGGAEYAVADIVNAIHRLGHRVYITACEPRDMGATIRLEEEGLSYDILFNKRRSKNLVLLAFIKRILSFRPDVIMTSLNRATFIGQIAGKLTGIPVISFKNSTFAQKNTRLAKNISKLWIGDSHTVVQFLKDDLHIPEHKVMNWPLYYCNKKAPQADRWDGCSELRLGSLGRLCSQKNYSALLKGIALFLEKHPEWSNRLRVTILGEGDTRKILEQQREEWQLEQVISLPGHSADIEEFLSHQHAYLQPSLFEGMCIAAHEAMNAGLPLVATPVGELTHVIKHQRVGFLLEGDPARALCDTLENIINNPALLEIYGKNALSYVRDTYSKQAFHIRAESIMGAIKEITGQLHPLPQE